MALGMGIGFERNIPINEMTGQLSDVISSMKKGADEVTRRTPITTGSAIRSVTNHYTGNDIDYKKIEEAQERAYE